MVVNLPAKNDGPEYDDPGRFRPASPFANPPGEGKQIKEGRQARERQQSIFLKDQYQEGGLAKGERVAFEPFSLLVSVPFAHKRLNSRSNVLHRLPEIFGRRRRFRDLTSAANRAHWGGRNGG